MNKAKIYHLSLHKYSLSYIAHCLNDYNWYVPTYACIGLYTAAFPLCYSNRIICTLVLILIYSAVGGQSHTGRHGSQNFNSHCLLPPILTYLSSLPYFPLFPTRLSYFRFRAKIAIVGFLLFSSGSPVRACWAELKYDRIVAVGGRGFKLWLLKV